MTTTLEIPPQTDATDVESTARPLAELIEDHQDHVWRYLRALGCQPHEADDLTQETFLLVFRSPFRYVGHAAAASYLRRVAYHRLASSHRRPRLPVCGDDLGRIDDYVRRRTSARNESYELDALAECLAALPERSRLSLELRFRDGYSRKQIAAALQISESGAKNLMQRAKQRLRESLERRMRQ